MAYLARERCTPPRTKPKPQASKPKSVAWYLPQFYWPNEHTLSWVSVWHQSPSNLETFDPCLTRQLAAVDSAPGAIEIGGQRDFFFAQHSVEPALSI